VLALVGVKPEKRPGQRTLSQNLQNLPGLYAPKRLKWNIVEEIQASAAADPHF